MDHIAGNSCLRERGIDVDGHPSIAGTDLDLAQDVADDRGSIDPERP